MSGNVRLMWEWPTHREREDGSEGRPLVEGEISRLTIDVKLEAAPDTEWTEILSIDYDAAKVEETIPDVQDGTWQFRAQTHGQTEGDVSEYVLTSITVGEVEPQRMGRVRAFLAEEVVQ